MRGVDRPWPEAALALAAVAAGLAIAGLRPSWDGWKPATCVASGCFCESPRARGVRQPADAWSNVAFLAVGLWISLQAGAEGSALSAAQTRALGFMTVFIGAGSLFFHASLTLAGEFLDVMGEDGTTPGAQYELDVVAIHAAKTATGVTAAAAKAAKTATAGTRAIKARVAVLGPLPWRYDRATGVLKRRAHQP